LMGFWEMIYFQVIDVDKKFAYLEELENNGWKEIVPEIISKKKTNQLKKVKVKAPTKKGASSGLKAMMAARRKALTEARSEKSEVVESGSNFEEKSTETIGTSENFANNDTEKSFDGGFFSVKSPITKTPNVEPVQVVERLSSEKKRGTPSLRRSVLVGGAKKSGLLLSPYVSQSARRSLSSVEVSSIKDLTPSSPSSLIDLRTPSPKTYSKAGSPVSVAAPHLDMFDLLTGDTVNGAETGANLFDIPTE